jgi:hypothetical protein
MFMLALASGFLCITAGNFSGTTSVTSDSGRILSSSAFPHLSLGLPQWGRIAFGVLAIALAILAPRPGSLPPPMSE